MTINAASRKLLPADIGLLMLALIPAIFLFCITWNSGGTPVGDGYIQELFTVLHYLDAGTATEKISNTWWTYFQNRSLLSKTVVLLTYFITGRVDLKIIGIISSIFLCGIAVLMAWSIIRHKMSHYYIPVASLMILSIYPWTVISWPECGIFYFGTLFFSMLCFHLLDMEKPNVVAAMVCSWIATLTMANGILSILIGSMMVLYLHYDSRKFSKNQIFLWFSGSAICAYFHLSTMNVFSTDLYGAKSLDESFVNITGRLVDFLESMGATPFFPNENRAGKIFLGCTMLALIATLATSRKKPASPAIAGLMLFSTGTIFLTSIFRYSAGGNDGYQIFTSINMATALILASNHANYKHRKTIHILLVIAAIAYNLNAAIENTEKILNKNILPTKKLEDFLVTGKSKEYNWANAMLQESIKKDIYRPLATHGLLAIVSNIEKISNCPAKSPNTTLDIFHETRDAAFAIRISTPIPKNIISEKISLLLCGEQESYRIGLTEKNRKKTGDNTELAALLDKRVFNSDTYRVYIETPTALFAVSQPLSIGEIAYPDRSATDCRAMKDFFSFKKAFFPIIAHYCETTDNNKNQKTTTQQ